MQEIYSEKLLKLRITEQRVFGASHKLLSGGAIIKTTFRLPGESPATGANSGQSGIRSDLAQPVVFCRGVREGNVLAYVTRAATTARRAPAKRDSSVLNLVIVPESAVLAEGFVEDDACGVGEVQTAVEFTRHGNAAEIIFIPLVKFLRQTGGFSAENEIVSLLEFHIKKLFFAVG